MSCRQSVSMPRGPENRGASNEIAHEHKRRKSAKRGGTILDLISWTLIITLLGAVCVIAAKAGQDKQDSINQQQSGWEK